MNGILLINKDVGYTSRDIVNIVSKKLHTKKVGHVGALDPMASGLLILCVGNALKVAELLTNHDKEYIAGITLGIETDTLDMDGSILKEENVNVSETLIKEVISSFKGSYMQQVPKYSAVKVNGKKLYEYARNNIDVELPSREVNIYDISVLDDIVYKDNKVYFKIKCMVSKGTYIRSLVRDIGKKLNTIAVMNSLVRLKINDFDIADSYTLSDIENDNFSLIDTMDAFPNVPRIVVDDNMAFKIRNGVIIDNLFSEDMAFILDKDNTLMALYKREDKKCRVYKMFV